MSTLSRLENCFCSSDIFLQRMSLPLEKRAQAPLKYIPLEKNLTVHGSDADGDARRLHASTGELNGASTGVARKKSQMWLIPLN